MEPCPWHRRNREKFFDGRLVASAAASAAVAAASTASATAATAAAAAVPAATAPALFARLRFIDRQGTAIVLLAVEGLDGRLGLLVVGHFDESEPFAAAALAVLDHLVLWTVPKAANSVSNSELLTL